MHLDISKTPQELGEKAAKLAAQMIGEAIGEKGRCRAIFSTGMSQFEFFNELVRQDIPWHQVEIFHLDEYIGLPEGHKASFAKYIQERFLDKISAPKLAYLINGNGDVQQVIREINELIAQEAIDVGLIGIGENAHIAFNDPPADFNLDAPFRVVTMDERCRMQQVGEGWFGSFEEVPETAITATVKTIMSCKKIISVVPHQAKAEAIKNTLNQPVNNNVPATILNTHPDWHLFLDEASASLLQKPMA